MPLGFGDGLKWKENTLCKSVASAIMVQQSKCTQWAQSFEAGMELPLEICKMLDFRAQGRQEVRRGALAASDVMLSQIQPSEFFLMT